MKKEDKELLLKDLSARLPYGTKLDTLEGPQELNTKWLAINMCNIASPYLPYLFPISSMTEEQKKELLQISNFNNDVDEICDDFIIFIERTTIDIVDIANFISWLNAHHFDYRGLIKKGLAIEAPEGMYK